MRVLVDKLWVLEPFLKLRGFLPGGHFHIFELPIESCNLPGVTEIIVGCWQLLNRLDWILRCANFSVSRVNFCEWQFFLNKLVDFIWKKFELDSLYFLVSEHLTLPVFFLSTRSAWLDSFPIHSGVCALPVFDPRDVFHQLLKILLTNLRNISEHHRFEVVVSAMHKLVFNTSFSLFVLFVPWSWVVSLLFVYGPLQIVIVVMAFLVKPLKGLIERQMLADSVDFVDEIIIFNKVRLIPCERRWKICSSCVH